MAGQPQIHESIIDKIKAEMYDANLTLGTRRATEWLIKKIRSLGRVNRAKLMKDEERLTARKFVGGMYLFYYDPKTKAKLKYYDKFPLVIPIEIYPDGWLGLNLHYVSPRVRAVLLNKMSQYTNNMRYDESTRFRLTWDLIKAASQLQDLRPCIKRYLASHLRSDFLRIDGTEWAIAAMLPVEMFVKASPEEVWRDSASSVGRGGAVGKHATGSTTKQKRGKTA
jgi:hypothetical protein